MTGRVAVYTTPGGHRRFDRRALERLASERRPGTGRRTTRPPARPLASLGATPERLQRVYRRSYSATPTPDGRRWSVRPSTTTTGRPTASDGRRLVAALVAYLDADPGDGAARAAAEADADGPRRRPGPTAGGRRHVSLTEAVALFVAARRPFLAELAGLGRRRTLDPARLGACTRTRPPARPSAPPAHRHPSGGDALAMDARVVLPTLTVDPRPGRSRSLLFDQWRRAARRVPARLGVRDALLRHRLGLRGHRRARAAGTRRCTGPGTSPAPSGPPAGWGWGRPSCSVAPGSATASRSACSWPACSRSSSATSPSMPGAGTLPAAVLHRGGAPGARGRGRDVLPERPLADARGRRGRRGDRPLDRPDGGRRRCRPGLCARPRDRRPGRDAASRRSSGCSPRS